MDYFDPSFSPILGADARVYLIYLTADGTGQRIFYGRDDEAPNQINFPVYGPDRSIIGYGSPIFVTDFFTQRFSTTYPGLGGEAIKEIDQITQREFLQVIPTSLYVDQYGDIRYKSVFADANKLRATADNVDEVTITGLPGGTIAYMAGLTDAEAQVVTVDDGTFEVSSPITGSLRLRLTHPGYIQRDYRIDFV